MPNKPDNRTEKRKLGDIGENIACEFLMKRGFEILDRNYLKKWGEIDIVARKAGILRFIEVKSVRQELKEVIHETIKSVEQTRSRSREFERRGKRSDTYRPEENVHPAKLKRLYRTMQTYMLSKRLDCDWQLDIITVKIDETKRIARVEILENIVL